MMFNIDWFLIFLNHHSIYKTVVQFISNVIKSTGKQMLIRNHVVVDTTTVITVTVTSLYIND